MPSLVSLYLLGSAIQTLQAPNQLSIHGRTHDGRKGPKPSHKPIISEFDPNSTTQKRKANRDNHPTPNRPGSNRNTLKSKRAARRRSNKTQISQPSNTASHVQAKQICWQELI